MADTEDMADGVTTILGTALIGAGEAVIGVPAGAGLSAGAGVTAAAIGATTLIGVVVTTAAVIAIPDTTQMQVTTDMDELQVDPHLEMEVTEHRQAVAEEVLVIAVRHTAEIHIVAEMEEAAVRHQLERQDVLQQVEMLQADTKVHAAAQTGKPTDVLQAEANRV